MPDYVQVLSTIAALLTAIGGFYVALSVQRKNAADAASALTDAAMDMLTAKTKDYDDLKKDQIVLRLYTGYLMAGIRLLQKQLEDNKLIPVFDPKSLEEYKQ